VEHVPRFLASYFDVLESCKNLLTPLGGTAKVKLGFTAGAKPLFLSANTFFNVKANEKNLLGCHGGAMG